MLGDDAVYVGRPTPRRVRPRPWTGRPSHQTPWQTAGRSQSRGRRTEGLSLNAHVTPTTANSRPVLARRCLPQASPSGRRDNVADGRCRSSGLRPDARWPSEHLHLHRYVRSGRFAAAPRRGEPGKLSLEVSVGIHGPTTYLHRTILDLEDTHELLSHRGQHSMCNDVPTAKSLDCRGSLAIPDAGTASP
jgi:hypothetical protein